MNKFIDELTMASYESEIDLDRDVPSNDEFQEFKNCGGMDGFPHGPDSVEASKWFDEDDFTEVRGDDLWEDVPEEYRSVALLLHGPDAIDVDKVFNDDGYFEKYCEDHPDFNAALNGHPDYI